MESRDFDRMCKTLGLNQVRIMYANVPNAEARMVDGKPYVMINPYLGLTGKPLSFVVGHELGHIASGDLMGIKPKSSRKIYGFMMVAIALFIILVRWLSLTWPLFIFFLLLLAFDFYITHIFDSAMKNFFYYEQMKELRADRIGYQVSSATMTDVRAVADLLPDSEGEHNLVGLLSRLLIRLHVMPRPEDLHPFWNIRLNELEKHGSEPWSIRDDIRYTWRFSFGLLFGNDWRI